MLPVRLVCETGRNLAQETTVHIICLYYVHCAHYLCVSCALCTLSVCIVRTVHILCVLCELYSLCVYIVCIVQLSVCIVCPCPKRLNETTSFHEIWYERYVFMC